MEVERGKGRGEGAREMVQGRQGGREEMGRGKWEGRREDGIWKGRWGWGEEGKG